MIRVRYHHKPADQSIEVTFKLITRSGKGKSRKRSQRSVEALPAMSLDNVGEEFAELVHREYHEANRRILLAVKAAKEAAVPPQADLAAMQHEHDRATARALDEMQRKASEVMLGQAAPQPTEPVIEIRPSRQPVARKGGERSEADEIAEGLALVAAANAQVS